MLYIEFASKYEKYLIAAARSAYFNRKLSLVFFVHQNSVEYGTIYCKSVNTLDKRQDIYQGLVNLLHYALQ